MEMIMSNPQTEISPEDLLKQGQQTVEELQQKIANGTDMLAKWQVQLNAQQSYNDQIQAGLGSKKTRKKRAVAKTAKTKAAPKTAAKTLAKKKGKKAAAAAAPAKKTGKKAGKKATAKKASVKKATAKATDKGGKIPSLTHRLIEVMGSEATAIPEVIDRLQKKNWAPESKDLPTYISYMLSSHKETFERVSRGVYRVLTKTTAKAPKAKAKAKVSPNKTNGVAPKRKAAAAAPAQPSKAEQELEELGATDGTVPSNPFEV